MTLHNTWKYNLLAAALFSTPLFIHAENSKDSTAQSDELTMNVYASRDNHGWGAVYMDRSDVGKRKDHIVNSDKIPEIDSDPQLKEWQALFGENNAFQSKDGKSIYHHSCAGCHLHKGEGGQGAGYYPPLANNPKMDSEDYVYSILINGFRGMPSFRGMLDNEQMVEVVRYIQQELNDYHHDLNAEDVAALRHENPPKPDPSDG